MTSIEKQLNNQDFIDEVVRHMNVNSGGFQYITHLISRFIEYQKIKEYVVKRMNNRDEFLKQMSKPRKTKEDLPSQQHVEAMIDRYEDLIGYININIKFINDDLYRLNCKSSKPRGLNNDDLNNFLKEQRERCEKLIVDYNRERDTLKTFVGLKRKREETQDEK